MRELEAVIRDKDEVIRSKDDEIRKKDEIICEQNEEIKRLRLDKALREQQPEVNNHLRVTNHMIVLIIFRS